MAQTAPASAGVAHAGAAAARRAPAAFSRHVLLPAPHRPVAAPLGAPEPPSIDLGTAVLVALRRGSAGAIEGVVVGFRPPRAAGADRPPGPLFYVVQVHERRLLCQASELVVVAL